MRLPQRLEKSQIIITRCHGVCVFKFCDLVFTEGPSESVASEGKFVVKVEPMILRSSVQWQMELWTNRIRMERRNGGYLHWKVIKEGTATQRDDES